MSIKFKPILIDRYGGKTLEHVVAKNMSSKRWLICARTESYGGLYHIPIAWETRPGRHSPVGWKLKRDALAYLATLPQPSKGA